MIGRNKKAILSPYQVGVASKHSQNEDEKHVNSNNSNKRNMSERIRGNCIQDSGPPGYKHNFKQKWGVQSKMT